MDNDLSLYQKILFLDLRPWTNRNITESKYKELLQGISKEDFSFQPRYEVAFEKPLTPKRKYYHALIENEAIRYLNNFHSIVESAQKEVEKKYWVHTTLTKVISQKLKETCKTIDNNQYYGEWLTDRSKIKSKPGPELDEAYIIQFLKYQLLRIYLEIQESFQFYLKEDAVTEDEIHAIFFPGHDQINSIIKPAEVATLLKSTTQQIKPDTEIIFKPEKREIREPIKGVLQYKEIVEKTDQFARIEFILFEQKLIDEHYQFKTIQGNISKMAAVYRMLFNNNIFKSAAFTGKGRIKVTDLHVKKFLNHRYAANIDKEFRNFKDQSLLTSFLSNNLWISYLPSE